MRISTALAAAALACAAAPASAATTYTDFAAFLAASGPLVDNTLDSGPDINGGQSHDYGDFTLALEGSSSLQFAIEGASGKALVGFPGDSLFTFTFDAPVTSFGLKVFDLGEDRTPVDLVFKVDGVDHTLLSGVANQPSGQMLFAGVVDAAGITSIAVFGAPATGLDLYVLDDVVYAAAIPEPASWALMLLGFGALGAAIRGRALRAA